MSLTVILSLAALGLIVATACSGVAIALLERKRVVPRLAETAFMGLAGAGTTALVASVVSLHPLTEPASAEQIAVKDPPACVSLSHASAYDPQPAEMDVGGGRGEVSVFRSSRTG